MPRLTLSAESWPLREAFVISRGSRTETPVVVCALDEPGARGRGECHPNPRYGDTTESILAELEALRPDIESGALDRLALQERLSAGPARNALDCAFWDLEAKRAGKRVWELAGLPAPGPVTTVYTLSVGSPEAMGAAAARNAHRPLIKMKLTGEGDLDRVRAVRAALPDTPIVADANEGWEPGMVERFARALAELDVRMVEQPLPASADAPLGGVPHPVPFCADESCHTSADVPRLAGLYDMVNIKLDKTGGLTEALKLRSAAGAAGLGVMVGCMVATSLSMAPGVIAAQGAAFVDLDGPLLLAKDREPGLRYDAQGRVHPPEAALWG